MEDLSESTTEQIEFIEYLLQVKYQELEANQKLEHKMASEFKVTSMTHGHWVMDTESSVMIQKLWIIYHHAYSRKRWEFTSWKKSWDGEIISLVLVKSENHWIGSLFRFIMTRNRPHMTSFDLFGLYCSQSIFHWSNLTIDEAMKGGRWRMLGPLRNALLIKLASLFRPIFKVSANEIREWGHICKFLVFKIVLSSHL